MSEIIGYIISYVVAYLLALAIVLPIAYIEIRKLDKHISNKMSTFRESRAALDESQDESRAQVDEISESMDEIHQSFDEIHQSINEINESLDRIDKSLDKMDKSMDRTIEFKRLMRDYSNYKIKRIEARENFCESPILGRKKYTLSRKTLLGSEREKKPL